MTRTPSAPSNVTVRCDKRMSENDFHREYATSYVPWQCRCSVAARESGDCCSHQRRWEPWKVEWRMSKKPSFKTKDCYEHGDAIPKDNSVKRGLTEVELKAPSGSALWEMTTQKHLQYDETSTMIDTRQIHTLSCNCKTRKARQAVHWWSNALETLGRATKVPSDR